MSSAYIIYLFTSVRMSHFVSGAELENYLIFFNETLYTHPTGTEVVPLGILGFLGFVFFPVSMET